MSVTAKEGAKRGAKPDLYTWSNPVKNRRTTPTQRGNTMKTLDQLQDQRAAMLDELEGMQDSLSRLHAAVDAAPTGWNELGHPTGSPEGDAARAALSDTEARIHSTARSVERLDVQIAHVELTANADGTIIKARAAAKAVTEQAARLTISLDLVRERLTSLQSEALQAKESAQQSEQNAANAIASATASGNSKAAKEAQSMIEAAIEEGRQAEDKERQSRAVVSALEAEAEALAAQLVSAQQRADAAYHTIQNAERLKLREEWNRAVEALAVTGVLLVEAGERFASHGKLAVPTFGPIARALDASEIDRRVKEKAA